MPSDRPPLTQARLKELLHYDPETGLFTWRVRRNQYAEPGMVANYRGHGYIHINIGGKLHRAHRLAFLYMTGGFPENDVDHINRDRADNRWANLRPATRSENKLNGGHHRDNKSGHNGVSWFARDQKWRARGTSRGKQHHLGYFETLEEAAAVADAWRKEHHGEFYSCIPNPETLSPTPKPEP